MDANIDKPQEFNITDRTLPDAPSVKPVEPVAPAPPPTAVAPPSLAGISADDFANLGREIAEQMDARGFHPVVIFGSVNSGKSSLMASLLSYLRLSHELQIDSLLAEPLISEETDYGRYVHQSAEWFFYKSVQDFIAGTGHNATRVPAPYFIPVIVRPKEGPEMRFAFMESNGEWYHVNHNSHRFFPQLRQEVEGLLRHYPKGMSLIYVAPFTQQAVRGGEGDPTKDLKGINDAGLALTGVLKSYSEIRTTKEHDQHIFLVTKWDAYRKQDEDLPLKRVLLETTADVEPFVTRYYTQALTSYKLLPAEQRQMLQYCSGLMTRRDVVQLSNDNELWPVVSRYPRTLWNWLYGNATRSERGETLVLVKDQPVEPPSLLERIRKFLMRLLS